jgi:subtilase family serine protease
MNGRFARRRAVAFGAAVLLVGLLGGNASASSTASSVVVGDTPPLPAQSSAVGALPAQTQLGVTIVLAPRNPSALASAAQEVSTPGSEGFHQYLSVNQFAARFGAPSDAVAKVRAALTAAGLQTGPVAADGLSLSASGDASAVSRAFGVGLDRYRRANGPDFYANTTRPLLPAALAGTVEEVVGLDNLPAVVPAGLVRGVARRVARTASAPATTGPQPCAAATNSLSHLSDYTIDEIAGAYGMDGLYANGDLGAGVTIALFELEPYLSTDLAGFQACFGTNASVTNIPIDGGPGPAGPGSGETTLDLDNVIGMAPASSVEVYQGPNTSNGAYDTLAAIIDQDTAQVVNYSWTLCEPESSVTARSAENVLFEQAALEGQSVFAASGDAGSEACANSSNLAVNDPASQPYVTGVGGTHIDDLGPPPVEETYNDDPGSGAGGGGISAAWPMPSYQTALGINTLSSGTPCGAPAGAYCREVPDVSADASPYVGYAAFHNGAWGAWGGTSAAAPVWAALTALADASGIGTCTPAAPLGFLNPQLYEIAAGAEHADALNDVSRGDNNPSAPYSTSAPYPATSGYDMATGLGTPLATDGTSPGLVDQLCASGNTTAETVTALSPSDAPPGATITVTGSGFTNASTVDFGSVAATAVDPISPTELTATVPPGAGVVEVTVSNPHATNAIVAADTFTYAPTVTISTPAPGASYTQGQPVSAAFSCSASALGTSSCIGPVSDEAAIDTSSVGAHAFTVTGTDADGVAATQTVDYAVVAPPTATITVPANGATYDLGQIVNAAYACAAAAPGGSTCTGTVGNGAQIETATVGTHAFSVTVVDSNGVARTSAVSYTVLPAIPSISDLRQSATAWLERRLRGSRSPVGTAFSFTLSLKARVTLTFTRIALGRSTRTGCKAPSTADARGRPCSRSLAAGTVTFAADAGLDTFRFLGRTSRGVLAPGTYRVAVTAVSPSGYASSVETLRFVIAARA